MPTVRLDREEAEREDLPTVCMCCWAPATTRVSKTFSWHPSWVLVLLLLGLVPYAIAAIVTTKKMRIAAPLCEAHKRHWSWRALLIWCSFGGVGILGAAGVALLWADDSKDSMLKDLGGYLCVSFVMLLFCWIVLVAILQGTSIRPTEITDQHITLAGISPEFTQAFNNEYRHRFDIERYRSSRSDYQKGPIRYFHPRQGRPDSQPPDAYREGDPPPQ